MRRRELLFGAFFIPGDVTRKLRDEIATSMRSANVPGLSIAVVKDAKLAWTGAFGVKDVASKQPVDARTMFEAASMSKPVFAYAVMRLVEKGLVDLDKPLMRERPLRDDPRVDLITPRHVLSHTCGLQNWRSEKEPLKIHFTPGEKYLYSGEGYSWLQSVVTALTGRVDRRSCKRFEAGAEACATDFDDYMRRNVLSAIGMASSCYAWNADCERRMARPHNETGEPLNNNKSTAADVARYGSAGALLTTAADYANFLIEMMRPRRLRTETVAEMLRPHVKVMDGEGFSVWWGLGWKVVKTAAGDLISHGGDNKGFHCLSEFSPSRGSGFVILTNGENGFDMIQKLAPVVSRLVHA